MEKTCTRCGETKPLEGFRRHKGAALGRRPECKTCDQKRWKAKAKTPPTDDGEKRCCDCGENKPVTSFYRSGDRRASYCKPCHNVRSKDWNERHPDKVAAGYRRHDIKKRYGISEADYSRLLAGQLGVCAICQKPETNTFRGQLRSLAIDHDHRTGVVRALLCSHCNRSLGHFGDDPQRLRTAAAYLDAHQGGDAKP